MSEHPSGLVTFLFTDIEGSTRLGAARGGGVVGGLARWDVLGGGGPGGRQGFELGGGGVSFRVREAGGGGGGRRGGGGVGLRGGGGGPRGLGFGRGGNAGGCWGEGEYFGPEGDWVARLEAIAHGGQVVLSGRATGLLGDRLPDGVQLRDMGEHRLKDLIAPERVFQLEIEGLPAEFPPLRSLAHPALRNNLPRYASSLVGRTTEVSELQSLVGDGRLVTLVGAGGCGKTRLAVQVAAELLDGSGDGVWLVELAALSDGALVAATVASALGIRPEPASRDRNARELAPVAAPADRLGQL